MRTKKRSRLRVRRGRARGAAGGQRHRDDRVHAVDDARPAPDDARREADPPAGERGGGAPAGRDDAGRVDGPQAELQQRRHRGAGRCACRRRPPRSRPRRTGSRWKQLGPYNIGGRVTDVVADRFTPNSAFAAVSGGGIWKTTDGGANWTSIWPDANTQTMGAVRAGAQTATLWAGTGEANPPGGGLTYFGDGVYKSTDNGAHWTNMGLAESAAIGRIAVDPTNSNRVFVAAAGHIARTAERARPVPHDRRRQDVGARARAAERDDRRDRRRHQPEEPADRLRVAVGPQAHQRHAHLRRRRLRPVPLQGRRRHVGAPGEHRRPAADLRPDADRPEVGREPRSHRRRDRAEQPEPHVRRLRLAVRARTRASTTPTTAATRCQRRLGRAYRRPAATSGGSAASGSTRTTRTTSSTPTSSLRTSTDGGTTWTRDQRPHADQHGMDWDPSTLDGNPATPRPRLPRQRRRHVPLREQRRQRLVGEGHQPAVEPGATTSRSPSRTRSA